MDLAMQMIDQSFANAGAGPFTTYSEMVISTLREIEDEQLRAVALVDDGSAGLKLIALTKRFLVIADQWGGIAARHGVDEIVEVDNRPGGVDVVCRSPGCVWLRYSFGHKDRDGMRALAWAFERIGGQ